MTQAQNNGYFATLAGLLVGGGFADLALQRPAVAAGMYLATVPVFVRLFWLAHR